jgi:hypothetical protein
MFSPLRVRDEILIIIHLTYIGGDGINLTMFIRFGTQTITKLIAGSGSYMGVSKMITAAS